MIKCFQVYSVRADTEQKHTIRTGLTEPPPKHRYDETFPARDHQLQHILARLVGYAEPVFVLWVSFRYAAHSSPCMVYL